MFNLQLFNKVSEVEKQTGQSLPDILSKVPFGNVVTAFKVIPVNDLITMVKSVSIDKLVDGLGIITPKEIEEVSPAKLLIVLVKGNMDTVRLLQEKYSEEHIIKALSELSDDELTELLVKDDFKGICTVIDGICGIIEG